MEIKLNRELQKKLDIFLSYKDLKLEEFLSIIKIDNFSYTKDEINLVEELYKKDESLHKYVYIYIGEAVLNTVGGFWSIGKFKKDEAYGLPIILAWGASNMNPRICPEVWLSRIKTNRLGKSLGDLIFCLD